MKQLLAAVDLSAATTAVIDQAAKLSKALDTKLWVLHVATDEAQAMAYEATQFTDYTPGFTAMPGDVQLARDISAEEIKREHSELLNISAGLRNQGVEAQAILLKGQPADLILKKAEELNADIIILGSHNHGLLHKALLGSVSETVVRQAPCNVLMVPAST